MVSDEISALNIQLSRGFMSTLAEEWTSWQELKLGTDTSLPWPYERPNTLSTGGVQKGAQEHTVVGDHCWFKCDVSQTWALS